MTEEHWGMIVGAAIVLAGCVIGYLGMLAILITRSKRK